MPRDPFLLDPPHAIHFSGGRTSGYMLRRHLDASRRAVRWAMSEAEKRTKEGAK